MPTVPTFEQKKVVSLFAILAYIGLILGGLWLLYALRALIPPFLIATIFAMTLNPEVDRIERRGYPRWLAIGVIYIAFVAICTIILVVLIPLISVQMSGLVGVIPGWLRSGDPQKAVDHVRPWLIEHHVTAYLRNAILNTIRRLPQTVNSSIDWATSHLLEWAGNMVWGIIVAIVTFLILLDFHKILGKILILVPQERRRPVLSVVTEVIALFGSYVRSLLVVMLLDIVVISVVLNVAGLKQFAWTLAAVAGILYTIPYFGAIVSTLLIGLVTLATKGLVASLIVTAVMILIHQVLFDNIIAPRVIGGSVNLHPLLTLMALMAGGTLFGIGGTLLAVPIAAAAQVVIVHLFPQFRNDGFAERTEEVIKTTLAANIESSKASLKSRDSRSRRRNGVEPPSPTPSAAPDAGDG
jgi:predicted PurR-regulated permease PerM